ncbi:MAG: cysteine--1-D-myo-inosityl 2-amino-2-deoxy-alpha-D-glucopyranoside ligase [Actinomycetes bacterium]
MHAWPGTFIPTLPGTAYPLRVFDSATRECRPTATGDNARLYVCGITPYDATHLGHAATYLAFDLLNRQWRDAGFSVTFVENATDVDDPLLERAARDGIPWQELARDQLELFREDMTELRILPPAQFLGVVESMDLIVSWIERLIARGAAYQVGDDWYFNVAADPRFGQVAHLDRDTELALCAERGGDPDRLGKRDPLDPLLWRSARPGEPAWDSDLGPGRPGWHIECVAIAVDALGMSFDVQGGGVDLVFPHHEMSASQAQAATGEWPYARHYVHAGMVAFNGEKMSKSRGNLVFVSKLRAEGVDPMAIRLALLANHYRSDWEWTEQELVQGQLRVELWRKAVAAPTGPDAARTLDAVRRALANDLDAPGALEAIDAWAHEQEVRGGDDPSAPGIISRLCDALLGVAL